MSEFNLLLAGAAALISLLGIVLIRQARKSRHRNDHLRNARPVEMTCTVCQRQLVIHGLELNALSPPEKALVVTAQPAVVGRPLAEYVCPYCSAAHCFATDGAQLEWIQVNSFNPQVEGTLCTDCGKKLQRPPWPEGDYDGNITSAPLQADHGLVCPRCASVCCVECVKKSTRNRTPDGSYLCPRCHRGPVDKVFHY